MLFCIFLFDLKNIYIYIYIYKFNLHPRAYAERYRSDSRFLSAFKCRRAVKMTGAINLECVMAIRLFRGAQNLRARR
ncbi:hypothetical protein PUN28_011679 [Cardiocondyla obscurior]|uniref:Secreted protein n=1 Tax=Cardiocondyla obscurior TaxID=286306 RepID=A0AAW2FGE4_9HYME